MKTCLLNFLFDCCLKKYSGLSFEAGGRLKKICGLFLFFCLFFSGGFCAFGLTFYWRGGESGNWSDVVNWTVDDGSGGELPASAVPGGSDTAVFDGKDGAGNSDAYSSVTLGDSSVNAGEIRSSVPLSFSGALESGGAVSVVAGDLSVGGAFSFSGKVSVTAGNLSVGAKCTANYADLEVGGNIVFNTEYEGNWGDVSNIFCDGELRILGNGIDEGSDCAQFRGNVTAGSLVVEGIGKTSALGGCTSITTTGEQNYGGNFLVNNNLSIECTTATFEGKLVSWGEGSYKDVAITGNAVFKGDVGSEAGGTNNEKLKNLSVTGTVTASGGIYTAGTQSFGAAVVLTADDIVFATGGDPALGGKLTLGGGLTGTGTGNGTVWLCGTTATDREVEIGGAVSGVGNLVFNGNAAVNSSVSASGDVSFNKTATVNNANVSAEGEVVFNKDLNLAGSVSAKKNITFAEGVKFELGWWGSLSSENGNIDFGSADNPVKVELANSGGSLNVTVQGSDKKARFYGGFAEDMGLTLSGSAEIYGNNKFGENVTVQNAGEVTFKGENTFNKPVNFENTTLVDFDVSNTFMDSLTVKDAGELVFKGGNSFNGGFTVKVESADASGTVVKFQNGSTQTFSAISLTGYGEDKNVTLTALDGTGDSWLAVFSTIPSESNFKYSVIDKSRSVTEEGVAKPLGLVPSKDTVFDAGWKNSEKIATTKDWFTKKYFWLGAVDTDWNTVGNWFYDTSNSKPAYTEPPKDDVECEIVVVKGNNETSSPYALKAPSDGLKLKNILIEENAVFDLAGVSIVAGTEENRGNFTNKGTLRLEGVVGQNISAVMANGQDSTVEYYGSFSDFPWNGGNIECAQYENLKITGTGESSKKIRVAKKFSVESSVESGGTDGNVHLSGDNIFEGEVLVFRKENENLTLTGSNTFKGQVSVVNCGDLTLSGENHFAENVRVTVTGAGNVKINGDENVFVLEGGAECKTLHVQCPVKLGGNVTTTETSDFGGELTEAFGQFYEKNVFVNADAVLTDGAFGANLDATGKLVIEGNMKISGNLGTFAAPASVFVGGTADFSSGSAQKVITAGKQTYSKNITALSKLEITAGGTAESENYVVLHGFDAEASLLLTAETAELFYADYVSEGEQVFDCQTVKISANSENSLSSCQWAAKSAGSKITLQKENSRLFFDFGKEGENRELALKTDLSSADVFAYSGKITLSGEVTVSARNFTVWGKNYSAVDRCFSESNSRFAYFGDEALLPHSTAAEIGVSGEGTGEKVIEVSENFYVNGLDLQNLTLKIPDNSSSNPVFNSTAQVTERQWGLPYAVAFNSTISGTKAENGWLTASSYAQNCVDGGENSQVQFQSPKIQKAYSVYDDVVYVEFDMAVENSKGEVSSIFAQNYESAASGGVWYFGGTVQFEGVYSDPDCTSRLLEEDVTGFYLKGGTSWNTDATGSAPYSTALKAERDSTDRKGVHKTVTTDLSFLEGCFSAAEGKTFCQNYGAGTDRDTGSLPPAYTQTEDRAAPVLIAFYTGQELHTPGKSSEQKTYDSHNFMEFWYSEAVDIGELKYDGGDTNVRAVSGTGHISGNGTLTENNSGQTGLAIEGLASIDDGILLAFSKDGTDSPHALYRKFNTKAGEEEQIQTHRVRVGVAAFTDGTVTFTDSQNPALNGQYHNWPGCIKKAQTPKGTVTPVENSRITDIFGNVLDAAARNEGDAHRLPDLTVNSHTDGLGIKDSEKTGSLYGEWDVLPPVIAPIVSSRKGWNRWSLGSEAGGLDSPETSEIIGSSESTSDNIIKYIEVHLFDNDRTQAEIWPEIWWRTRKGWTTDLGNTSALPESRGGARPESSDSKTSGGIRLCSLKNENRSFSYRVKDMQTGSFSGAGEQYFDGATDISPTVFSTVFKPKDRTTSADGLYIRLPLKDTSLSVRTIFELAYNPEESYVTDLAGNLLSSSYPQKTCFDSLDLTPPSIILTLAPIGENKIYAVFSKQLDLTGSSTDSTGTVTDATDSASGAAVSDTLLAQIAESFVLVQKGSASGTAPEENAVVRAEYVSSSENYTALLFTLEKNIDLSDVENLWLRNTGWNSRTTEDLLGLTVADTKIRDSLGNYMNVNTGHTLSDFAVNALDVLYAYANQKNSDGWDEKSLYGENLAPASGDYAVHDFTAEQGNYGTLLEKRDITLQVKTAGEMPSDRKFILLPAKKSSLETGMVSDRINALLGTDWRLWLPTPLKPLATTPNTAILTEISPENAGLSETSDSTLWNYTFYDEKCSFKSGDEIQFLFKLAKADGTDVTIDSDADNFDGASSPSEEIPLYGVKMPLEKIQAGDFSFVDLWSFKIKGIKQQRGGVTILNNVINVNLREQTVVEVNVPEAGNLNVFVMTLDGNIVRRLNHGRVQAGTRYYRWDGTNAAGKPVARGLYFVRVVGPQIDETRKVLCVKE